MDFLSKNFVYRTLPLGEAVKRCSRTRHDEFFHSPSEMSVLFRVFCSGFAAQSLRQRYYVRALGEDPKKEPAKLEEVCLNLFGFLLAVFIS